MHSLVGTWRRRRGGAQESRVNVRMEADGGELAEDEEEKAEVNERAVMPEDEEVSAEGGEVEKKTFQCSEGDKNYSFLKLKAAVASNLVIQEAGGGEDRDRLCQEAIYYTGAAPRLP